MAQQELLGHATLNQMSILNYQNQICENMINPVSRKESGEMFKALHLFSSHAVL